MILLAYHLLLILRFWAKGGYWVVLIDADPQQL